MRQCPPASLSLDLDNKWAYLRAAGRENWESCDSYFSLAISNIVDVLGPLGLPLTVFLVGRDLQRDDDVQSISAFDSLSKWEAANHSLNHLPWMHTMNDDEIEREIGGTHDLIVSKTGQTPVGFRGPGFSCPGEVLRVLGMLGYQYDASIFPTSMAPIARAVFLARTKLEGEQREKAKKLYGGFAAMRNPNWPYLRALPCPERSDTLDAAEAKIWEVPVTVLPFLRTPIHFSYLTFVAGYSVAVAKAYFRTALMMCRLFGTAPSLLLHPPDFLGCEDDADMAYFPGMIMKRNAKLEFMTWALTLYSQQFAVSTMHDQVCQFSPQPLASHA
ncbi:polysaccharide deacetylase family protein [Aporhodopirellula aestuarii]|uniref:Polysaccharide deacetylase family protein n=1 Tax=Aporhodopirellula aestuarii TaxID=2950107 RepID=A0ABT0U2U9_9BACT|nr:polysaccharide deacetylase family protein [Aporhodopirellula aestuarii]MCM2371227.1 polysaccharide deacetylase family protein [Aporhodopirellula aestuarii]